MYKKNPLLEEQYVSEILTIGAKYYKQTLIQRKIMEKYPTAADLKAKLEEMGRYNPRCLVLAKSLSPDLDPFSYQKWIRIHFAGGTFASWLGNLLLEPFSTIYQVGSAIKTTNSDADDIINRRARI